MTTDEAHILIAARIDGDGNGTDLQGTAISQTLKAEALAWVHLDVRSPGTRSWLEREISYLDPIILDALLQEETRPRMIEFDSGVLLILRGINMDEKAEPEDMVSVRLWIDEHRIVSLQRRAVKSVQEIREKLLTGKGPKNSADFLSMLCALLFEKMEPVLTELDEQVDDLEEQVIEAPDAELRQGIIDARKSAIMLRRYIAPQRDVLGHIRTCELKWLDITNRRRLQESFDRLVRYTEDLDSIRERAQIVKDELTNVLSDRLNKNLYILSVIAAIFLPLGFLTGLLGINVGGIPGTNDPWAFWIFTGLLVALVAGQIALFKKLKWF